MHVTILLPGGFAKFAMRVSDFDRLAISLSQDGTLYFRFV